MIAGGQKTLAEQHSNAQHLNEPHKARLPATVAADVSIDFLQDSFWVHSFNPH